MPDPRHQKLANVLVQYSLDLKPGENVLIVSPISGAPLVREVYRAALRAGAHVHTNLFLDDQREILFREGRDDQVQHVSELDKFEVEFFDAALYVMADQNTRNLSGIDPKRMAQRSAARVPLSKREDERVAEGRFRWCLTLYPTNGYAQDAGMSLSDYEDFVYNAGLLNMENPVEGWIKARQEQQRIVDYLNQRDHIHVVAPGTDIHYRVGGRKWINADGRVNFPDGEVFSAPIEDSVNGTVCFSYPAVYHGNEVQDVRLTFKDGKVIDADATKGLDFLNAMLDTDAGSRTLGEVAFGTNYGIQQFTKEILFDEKIGGTMHMALGSSYGECGGKNESGLHWDMVCDLRQGRVTADGELCYENGKFII